MVTLQLFTIQLPGRVNFVTTLHDDDDAIERDNSFVVKVAAAVSCSHVHKGNKTTTIISSPKNKKKRLPFDVFPPLASSVPTYCTTTSFV